MWIEGLWGPPFFANTKVHGFVYNRLRQQIPDSADVGGSRGFVGPRTIGLRRLRQGQLSLGGQGRSDVGTFSRFGFVRSSCCWRC